MSRPIPPSLNDETSRSLLLHLKVEVAPSPLTRSPRWFLPQGNRKVVPTSTFKHNRSCIVRTSRQSGRTSRVLSDEALLLHVMSSRACRIRESRKLESLLPCDGFRVLIRTVLVTSTRSISPAFGYQKHDRSCHMLLTPIVASETIERVRSYLLSRLLSS